MNEGNLTTHKLRIIGPLIAVIATATLTTPQQPATANTTQTTDTCTLTKPTLTKIDTFPTGIWIDASTELNCTSGQTHPITWTLQIVETPTNPTHKECYNAEGQQVTGKNSSDETISFGMHGLTTWTDYDFRLGVSTNPDNTTTTPRWSSEGTETCTTATPDQKPPYSPWISATGENTRVRIQTKLQNYNTFFYAPVTKWQYTYKTATSNTWQPWTDINTGHKTTLNIVITDLTNNTTYTFKTRAINKAGTGAPSLETSATPQDTTNTPTTTTTTPTTPTTSPTTTLPSPTPTTLINTPTNPATAAATTNTTTNTTPTQDPFTDDNGSVHENHINTIANMNIIEPCNTAGTLFCPQKPLTRILMAVALKRIMNLEPPTNTTTGRFTDTIGHPHEPSVRAIAAKGITKGCDTTGPKFCPNNNVTRGAMATFLTRALNLQTPTDPTIGNFVDTIGHTHENSIKAIAAKGITVGCNAAQKLYCPDAPVTRAQMATFLVRAFNL